MASALVGIKPSSARQSMRLGTASVGPQLWQEETVKTLRLNTEIIKKSEKDKEYGRQCDPLPLLRDTLIQQSNNIAFGYVREVRVVVFKLREALVATNEEVKVLIKSKEHLEKSLDFVRKDIILNKRSIEIRETRPKREKEFDGADYLLVEERRSLEMQKKNLEEKLRVVRKMLINLNSSRKRLTRVLQERDMVLDLVCNSKNSTKHDYVRSPGYLTSRPNTVSGMKTPRIESASMQDILAKTSQIGEAVRRDMQSQQGMKRNALEDAMNNGVYSARTQRGAPPDGCRPPTPAVNPLGPYTPECAAAIHEACTLMTESKELRAEAAATVEFAEKEQKRAHNVVNDALTHKLSETISLTQQLNMSEAENRLAFNRAVRHYEMTDEARGYNLGPTVYGDLRTLERLDRPIMRVYQRHPGTNLPDARELIRGNNMLEASLDMTQKNVSLMHLSNLRMREDERDKKGAADIDASIIRLRKRRADHRWVVSECK